MSIYASLFYLPDDDNEPNLPAPIIYQHSGIYPNPNERGGYIEIGVPPGHIGGDDQNDGYCPYLRISVASPENEYEYGTSVVLDVAQVDALMEALQEWRARVIDEPHPG